MYVICNYHVLFIYIFIYSCIEISLPIFLQMHLEYLPNGSEVEK